MSTSRRNHPQQQEKGKTTTMKTTYLFVFSLVAAVFCIQLSMMRHNYFMSDLFQYVENSTVGITTVTNATINQDHSLQRQQQQRPTRVLLGIFTMLEGKAHQNKQYRQQFRRLFSLEFFKGRICPVNEVTPSCDLIYTFVVGGNPSAPPSIETNVMETSSFLIKRSIEDEPDDFTILNIHENMDKGKSPTWLGYASILMDRHNIDYVGKLDTDTLPRLDHFFTFVTNVLPQPAPTHRVLVGCFADALKYSKLLPKNQLAGHLKYIKPKFGKEPLYVYAQGQFYMLSRQLAKDIYTEYQTFPHFQKDFEDQIISAMALKSGNAYTQLVVIPQNRRFWRHPLKIRNYGAWKKAWKAEVDRLSIVFYNSTIQMTSGDRIRIPTEDNVVSNQKIPKETEKTEDDVDPESNNEEDDDKVSRFKAAKAELMAQNQAKPANGGDDVEEDEDADDDQDGGDDGGDDDSGDNNKDKR